MCDIGCHSAPFKDIKVTLDGRKWHRKTFRDSGHYCSKMLNVLIKWGSSGRWFYILQKVMVGQGGEGGKRTWYLAIRVLEWIKKLSKSRTNLMIMKSCHMFMLRCVVILMMKSNPDKDDEKKLVAKCICRGLSSRALIFHRTPIYGAGTPLVWGATPFFTPFYLPRTLSSHVEVRWGKRHPPFFAFPIRTKQKVSAHCIRSVWLIFTDKASALEIWYRQTISPVIFHVRIILDI